MFTSKKIKNNQPQQTSRIINLNQTSRLTDRLTKDTSRLFRGWTLILFGLILVGYLGWQIAQIIAPPRLEIIAPVNGLVVKSHQLLIRGQVEPASQLTLNDEIILPDAAGQFSQVVNLHNGSNVFIFTAQKRYSRPVRLVREVYLREEPMVQGESIDLTN